MFLAIKIAKAGIFHKNGIILTDSVLTRSIYFEYELCII